MYRNNSDIKKKIEKFTKRLIYNSYTGQLWDADCINNFDRLELAKEFVDMYFDEDRLQSEGYDSIGGSSNLKDFKNYIAESIDRLIPKLYFHESNEKLTEKYSALLTTRIFNTYGKDGFACTKDLKYFYKHDFSEEQKYITDTAVTEKQLEYLNKLAKQHGYQINNTEYMSKMHATSLIEYFSGNSDVEPIVFLFFTVMY